MTAVSSKENNFQLNQRILSVVMFTFVCYLTIGLPLAVLPGFVHNELGYNSVLAGLIISAQYFATLFSRPHAGRYADQLGPKKVVLFGLACCVGWQSFLHSSGQHWIGRKALTGAGLNGV